MDDLIITMAHFRSIPSRTGIGYCARGGRQWFAARGLDWADFARNGISAETLLATGDGFALAIVEHARQQQVEAARGQ